MKHLNMPAKVPTYRVNCDEIPGSFHCKPFWSSSVSPILCHQCLQLSGAGHTAV